MAHHLIHPKTHQNTSLFDGRPIILAPQPPLRYEIATMWLEITVEAEWDSVLSPFNYELAIDQTCVGNANDVTLVDCGVK